MNSNVPFHFLLLATGELLKRWPSVCAKDIQTFINNDEAFGVRPPLDECRLALQLLEDSGFIRECDFTIGHFERATK